ncbi:MAG: chitosanase [Austwickia sp.]|jgi:chitosanase|nr:MAG: chitosanase [Austwickia sp.]
MNSACRFALLIAASTGAFALAVPLASADPTFQTSSRKCHHHCRSIGRHHWTPKPTTPPTKPTTAPTSAPTSAPTTAPTTAPTSAPTSAPTTDPTSVPTSAPSATPTTAPSTTANPGTRRPSLTDPTLHELAWMLISSAENSNLAWRDNVGYLEYNVEGNSSENRGYTGGIVGFTSKTHDMLLLVQQYVAAAPTNNPLAKFLPALKNVDGTSSTAGLGSAYVAAWRSAASDPRFVQAQVDLADSMYFRPAVDQAKSDGLGALGQFAYFDAMVMHGPGSDSLSFGGIRSAALKKAKTPAQGGDEKTYLNAFLDARVAAMKAEEGHSDVSRVETAQRVFLKNSNLNLSLPLTWSVYGDKYTVNEITLPKA